jgi:hypothetical protein
LAAVRSTAATVARVARLWVALAAFSSTTRLAAPVLRLVAQVRVEPRTTPQVDQARSVTRL